MLNVDTSTISASMVHYHFFWYIAKMVPINHTMGATTFTPKKEDAITVTILVAPVDYAFSFCFGPLEEPGQLVWCKIHRTKQLPGLQGSVKETI